MIGFGMLGRAELAFVVMDIAYVQNDILNGEAFYTLMLTAFWLNVAVPITIAWWKPYRLRRRSVRIRHSAARAAPKYGTRAVALPLDSDHVRENRAQAGGDRFH